MIQTTNISGGCPKCGAPVPADAPQGLCPKCVLAGAAASGESARPPTATSEIPSLARVAAAFPQLEILELIGRGGMGFVFKARQPHLDRFVALKLLPDQLARDARFAERFGREGRVLARLNHSNIVSVFDFGSTEHFYFLLMEYVDGVNLRQAMQAGRFSPGEALAIVPKICEALQYAHEQGILHRDIKPENILLDARGRVKIADFGIAKLVGDEKPELTLTATGAALGTPQYMAPEQIEKPASVDHRADIYSLGVVFYEMLTGELPIGRFAPPSAKTPVGVNVDEVVFRTLEKDRERRFQSAGEMKTTVEQLSHTRAAGGPAAPAPGPEEDSKCCPPSVPPTGPRGTMVIPPGAAPPVLSRWSRRAVWGVVLTGCSLLGSLLGGVLLSLGRGTGPDGMLILLGVVGLPGLAGTILGVMAVSDIRAGAGSRRGLPLAIFAAVTWPVLLFVGAAVAMLYFVLGRPAGAAGDLPAAAWLLFLVPAGMITFALWAIHTLVRWGANEPPAQRRGVLKWVFLVLLAGGAGWLLTRSWAARHASMPPIAGTRAVGLAPTPPAPGPVAGASIRFTFTAVELRDDQGALWLAFDYVDQPEGHCERGFKYLTDVPGFKGQTRMTAMVIDDSAPPVRHQRVEFRLPDGVGRAELLKFRDALARRLVGKSGVVQPGGEYPLFHLPVEGQGTLAGFALAIEKPATP